MQLGRGSPNALHQKVSFISPSSVSMSAIMWLHAVVIAEELFLTVFIAPKFLRSTPCIFVSLSFSSASELLSAFILSTQFEPLIRQALRSKGINPDVRRAAVMDVGTGPPSDHVKIETKSDAGYDNRENFQIRREYGITPIIRKDIMQNTRQ